MNLMGSAQNYLVVVKQPYESNGCNFVCIGGKVGGNVLQCCVILKYRKIAIPLSFLKHTSKP
jgi:hypothetical protein